MRKIAFFVYDFCTYGGVVRVITNLAGELIKYADVYIISLRKKDNRKLEWFPDGVRYIELDIPVGGIIKNYFSAKKQICDVVNKYEIDVVVLQHEYEGFFGKEIKRLTSAKVISCDHGNIYDVSLASFKHDIKLARMAKGCDILIVETERCKNSYIEKFHIPEGKIQVIPNWLDEEIDHNDRYDIDSKKIISVGRLARQKGYDLLIEAFDKVHQKHPDWVIDLYGDGSERKLLEDMIEKYHLEHHIILKGILLDMQRLYRGYSFYVMSSRHEGFGMVLLEAKHNRLPAISFDIDAGPSDIITDGFSGILVKDGDVQGLADAICRMIENPDLRLEMSRNTQIDIVKFYKSSVLKKWLDILEIHV